MRLTLAVVLVMGIGAPAAAQYEQVDESIAEWQAAFEASQNPSLLFAIGEAQAGKGDRKAAIATFERYLQFEPRGDNADRAREELERLRREEEEAAAGPPPPPRVPAAAVELAVGSGFGEPLGKVSGQPNTSPIGEDMIGVVPVQAELSYRFSPRFLAGLFFSYSLYLPKDCASSNDADCSGHLLRFGLQVSFHMLPAEKIDPWITVGAGYESYSILVGPVYSFSKGTAIGWELANVRAGFDYQLLQRVWIGPFLSLSLDRTTKVDPGPYRSTESDFPKVMHEWLMLGARARVDI